MIQRDPNVPYPGRTEKHKLRNRTLCLFMDIEVDYTPLGSPSVLDPVLPWSKEGTATENPMEERIFSQGRFTVR